MTFDDPPPIDAALISHAHYDHLDRPTIKRLARRFDALFVAGLGLHRWLSNAGSERIVVLDWWQEAGLPEALTITATPARHWSRRGLTDRNRTLRLGY